MQAAQLQRGRFKPGPVIHRQFSLAGNRASDDSLRIAMSRRNGFLDEHMTSRRDRLPSERKVRLGRRCDVQDIRLFRLEHARHIGVPSRNTIADSQLFRHDRFQVADRAQLNRGNFSDLLNMRIRNLAAPNNRYLQTHCPDLPNQAWITTRAPTIATRATHLQPYPSLSLIHGTRSRMG